MLAVAFSVSCGGGAKTLVPNPGGNGAQISLNASSLSFGNVTVNSSKTIHLILSNDSASNGPSVTISQVTATGAGFSVSNNLPIQVTPGQNADLSVIFNPKTAGAVNGTLTIDIVGASDPATVPLTGTGTAPTGNTLTVSPSTMAFGSVNVGSSKNLTGTLTAGSTNLTVSSASWNGQGYTVSGINFPANIQAGKSISFTVTFSPQVAGSSSGSISFFSNASNSTATTNLTGSGAQVAALHSVSLNWTAPGASIAGYNVYRGTKSGGPYSRLNSALTLTTSYTDSTVQSGRTYFYVATSVDTSSSESAFSDEAQAIVP